jgi:ribosomal protein S8
MKRSYFFNFCTKLNQQIRSKSLYFDYNYSEKNEYFCNFLFKIKLIYNFNVFSYFCNKYQQTKFKLQVYLVLFSNKSIFRGLFLKRLTKSLRTQKLFQIRNICKNRKNILTPLYILQTSLGLLTHIDAELKNIGGVVVGKLYL